MSRAKLSWAAWPLRTTLTVVIAGLFMLAAGSALAVQYIVVSQALDQQIQTVRVGGPGAQASVSSPLPAPSGMVSDEAHACRDGAATPGECGGAAAQPPSPGERDIYQETTTLRDSVVGTMGISVIVSFALFAVVAALIARWVAARTVQRIAVISDLADRLDPTDLSQRLPETSRLDEIGQLTHTLNGMLARIESAVMMQREFISNASHELRTPIAAVQTNLEAPLMQGRFPADVVPSIRRALSANQKSAALISSLLNLSRTHGRAVLQPELIDLAAPVQRELAELAGLIDEKALRVRVGLFDAVAWADPVLSDLVVRNVIENAVRHAVTGGVVDLCVAVDGAMVVLVVSNTADVSDGLDLDALLQPFHRGDDSRLTRVPGFGLGLAIVDSAVTAQNGWVRLSQPDEHTFRIEVALPSAVPVEETVL
jgi:signal transduction histidine kinase